MELENTETNHGQPAPVSPVFQVTKQPKHVHDERRSSVIGQGRLHAVSKVVTDTDAALPGQNSGAESLVREPLRRVEKCILGALELHEIVDG